MGKQVICTNKICRWLTTQEEVDEIRDVFSVVFGLVLVAVIYWFIVLVLFSPAILVIWWIWK